MRERAFCARHACLAACVRRVTYYKPEVKVSNAVLANKSETRARDASLHAYTRARAFWRIAGLRRRGINKFIEPWRAPRKLGDQCIPVAVAGAHSLALSYDNSPICSLDL